MENQNTRARYYYILVDYARAKVAYAFGGQQARDKYLACATHNHINARECARAEAKKYSCQIWVGGERGIELNPPEIGDASPAKTYFLPL